MTMTTGDQMSAIDKSWEEDALCRVRGMDLAQFDDYGYGVNAAKRVCAMCPVQPICLQQNLDEPWGIWGGLNTPERKAYQEGRPILLCETCGSTFARSKGDTCMHCQTKPLAPSLLRDQVDVIGDQAANGRTDAEIAAMLCLKLDNQNIAAAHVRSVRRRHGIEAGTRRLSNNASAIPRTMGKKLKTYDDKNVALAMNTDTALGELSQPERLELLRRWMTRGGTKSTFARHYRCSGENVNKLLSELAANMGLDGPRG